MPSGRAVATGWTRRSSTGCQLSVRTGRVLTGGNLLLQLSLNGDDYDVGGARFYYYSVGTAFPRRGPSTGQSTVRLSGTYLHVGWPRRCWFGNATSGAAPVPASLLAGTPDLLCESPAAAAELQDMPSSVPLSLSLNGVDFEPAGDFAYYPEPSVTSILPTTGGGGTLVSVYGARLCEGSGGAVAPAPRCRFGSAEVAATFAASGSTRHLACVAPQMSSSAGPVVVRVSLDGGVVFTNQSVLWTPLDALRVVSVHPASGPIAGGTVVTVAAEGMGQVLRDALPCSLQRPQRARTRPTRPGVPCKPPLR